ncbi:MAG TPA: hypothetical protein VLB45_05850 [Nitrosopumilaceae archaeon]|nr:hypothetical protein [Nitrosopumilaceae archaeon]
MTNDELQRLLANVHKDITLFDYDGTKVPCIIFEEKKFDNVMKTVSGKPVSVETNLNILQDGLGHVFVEISLNFSYGGISEKILLYANESIEFFESLAATSMLALSSPHSEYGRSNVFMIQLPKPERAVNALEVIKNGLKK